MPSISASKHEGLQNIYALVTVSRCHFRPIRTRNRVVNVRAWSHGQGLEHLTLATTAL